MADQRLDSMSSQGNTKLILVLCLIAGVVGVLVFGFLAFGRESVVRDVEIRTHDGIMLAVHSTYSHRKFYSFGHAGGLGGGGREYELKIQGMGSSQVLWEGTAEPLFLNTVGGSMYLAAIRYDGDKQEPAFVLRKWDESQWVEVPPKVFPRNIAFGNLTFRAGNKRYDERELMRDPTFLRGIDFRTSSTARLWFCLVSGSSLSDVRYKTIPEDFVLDFYNREFIPAPRDMTTRP